MSESASGRPPSYAATSATAAPSNQHMPLQLLVTPLQDRLTYLHENELEGEIFLKGIGSGSSEDAGSWLDSLAIRLTIKDKLPSQPSITLYRTEWMTLFTSAGSSSSYSKHQEAYGPSHKFTIPLPSSRLPGCLHLIDSNGGEVVYELVVKAVVVNSEGGKEEVRETHGVHVTPNDPASVSSAPSDEAGPSRSTQETEVKEAESDKIVRRGKAEARIRLLVSKNRVRNTEPSHVGVEVRQTSALDTEGGAGALRGLRRVKLEWWRRIRTPEVDTGSPSAPSEEAGPSTSTSIPEPSTKDHMTLLHKSGKSCRYSSERPVRLLFELPPLANVTQMPGYGSCGEISQDTPYHAVTFLVRVIAGFDGDEGGDVTVEQEVVIDRPDCRDIKAREIVLHEEPEGGDLPVPVFNDAGAPLDEETRKRLYRLKGQDFVGDTGTYRQPESSAAGPSGTSGEDAEQPESSEPPPFAEAVDASFPAPPGELPSFAESQSQIFTNEMTSRQPSSQGPGSGGPPPPAAQTHQDRGRNSTQSTVSSPFLRPRTPPPSALTGELATWIEYDGYETFSQPPPTAAVSIGSSTSMDMPQGDDVGDEQIRSTLVREMNGGRQIGMEDRVRLMEQLGLGEGTRVFDMHGDLPPGIDEPSLPALPNAILPHHTQRHRQHSHPPMPLLPGMDDLSLSSPPPAFTSDDSTSPVSQTARPPPPSFAASEAAEARGLVAAGPEPQHNAHPHSHAHAELAQPGQEESGGRTPDLPPTYEGQAGGHAPPQGDAPPSYV